MSGLAPDQAAALNAAKLRALVRDQLGHEPAGATTTVRPGGAGLVLDGRGWYLPADAGPRALGGALAWAASEGADELHLLSGTAAAVLARRALAFDPSPMVWAIDGTTLASAAPEPRTAPPVPAPSTAEYVLMLEAAGIAVVVEHGVVTGDVDGLEIARVLVDDNDVATLEVGVGRHDREAFVLMHPDRPTAEALVDVAAAVRAQRRRGAEPHPLNRLAPSRRLRSILLTEPDMVGATELVPLPPAVPRDDLREDVPAAASGRTADGRPVVVVAAVGINLDLVPEAGDVRAGHDPDALLRLVVPERDLHDRIRDQANALVGEAEIVTVPDDWHRAQRDG